MTSSAGGGGHFFSPSRMPSRVLRSNLTWVAVTVRADNCVCVCMCGSVDVFGVGFILVVVIVHFVFDIRCDV